MDTEADFQRLFNQGSNAGANINERIAAWQQAIALKPAHVESLRRLAAAYGLAQRWRECLDCARQAAEAEPRSSVSWGLIDTALNRLGFAADGSNNADLWAEHLQWSNQYVARYQSVARAWGSRATAMAMLNDFSGSLAVLDD